jgi:hypothetical protein
MTLDNWAKENNIGVIDFIWCDVEGSEKEVIKGGLETLNQKTRFIYLEYVPDRSIWKGQIKLIEISNLLPNFELIGVFGVNILLKNMKLSKNT